MTEKLTTLLHDQADGVRFAVPDLDAMTSTGDRRIRRRRVGAMAGGAALVVALGVGLTTVLPGQDDAAPPPTDTFPIQARDFEPIATIGPRVFVGDRMINLGRWVDSLVRTQVGFVYTSQGQVRSWVDGRDELVGRSDVEPVSDQDGVLVAWTEPGVVDGTVEVLDQRDGEIRQVAGPDTGGELFVDALDGDTLYVSTDDRSVAVDVDDGDLRELDAALEIFGVENGVMAAWGEYGTLLGPVEDGADNLDIFAGDRGTLSPDGRWYAASDIFAGGGPSRPDVGVVDVATGESHRLDIEARHRDIVEPTGWLDDDTVTVAVVPMNEERAPEQLLACFLPSGECEAVIADHDALPGRSGMGKGYPGGGY